ncbi:hypothetical protein [Petrotoga sp. DB-2]
MFFHIVRVEEIEVQLKRVTVCVPSKAQSVQPVKVWSEERLATTSVVNSA